MTSRRLIEDRLPSVSELRLLRPRDHLLDVIFMQGDRIRISVEVNRNEPVYGSRDRTGELHGVAGLHFHSGYLAREVRRAR